MLNLTTKGRLRQDLFFSWPQLWCSWTQRVSPQHCSVAPVWDIAQGFLPALSVCWMSTTSLRTTDKLLQPPQKLTSSHLQRPSHGQRECCLRPVYLPDPAGTFRHLGGTKWFPPGLIAPPSWHTYCLCLKCERKVMCQKGWCDVDLQNSEVRNVNEIKNMKTDLREIIFQPLFHS